MVKRRNKRKLMKKQMEVDEEPSGKPFSNLNHNQQGDAMDTGEKSEDFIALKVQPKITKQHQKQAKTSKLSRVQKQRKSKALIKALEFGDKRTTKIAKKQSAQELRQKLKNLY
eukprot:TRINITY_DN5822_c1_g3_i1.p1 TRINITY_DN5822_c1_g3~~TRINITY_DN5822_c1_g3_i1.p1  ORF type:complete len:113 (-),score=18.92 TRINITY_DN5822_c1_g3_i1:236-574(-)